jgi:predicted dehydrogenase
VRGQVAGISLRLGIVGCGRFACEYHLPVLARERDCELAAVCEPDPRPEVIALGRSKQVPIVGTLDELLEVAELDAVLISTPHALHAAQIERCLGAGLHVLVDKPFVLDAADARRLTHIAQERQLVGAVGFNRRLAREYVYARDVIASGRLGAVRHADSLQLGYPGEGWYAAAAVSGGPFVGRGAHVADIIPWLVGNAPVGLTAATPASGDGPSLDHGGWWDVEFADITWRAAILPRGLAMYDQVRIFGEQGYVSVTRPLGDLAWPPRTAAGARAMFAWTVEHYDRTEGQQIVPTSNAEAEETLLHDFIEAVRGEKDPACSFADAVGSVAISAAAGESALAGGRRIDLTPLILGTRAG